MLVLYDVVNTVTTSTRGFRHLGDWDWIFTSRCMFITKWESQSCFEMVFASEICTFGAACTGESNARRDILDASNYDRMSLVTVSACGRPSGAHDLRVADSSKQTRQSRSRSFQFVSYLHTH